MRHAPPRGRGRGRLATIPSSPLPPFSSLCHPQRAREYLAKVPGGVGAYSESKGAVILRQHVAKVGGPGGLRWGARTSW